MPCLLLILLVLVLEFDIVLHLILDEFVLIGKGFLQQVDSVLLLVKVVIDSCVFVLVVLQLLFEDTVFL
jgi:hypothetical protein